MRASHTAGLVAAIGWAATVTAPARAAEPTTPLVVFYASAELGEASRGGVRGALQGAAQRIGSALVDLSPPVEPPVEASLNLRRAIESYEAFRYGEALTSADAGLTEATATGGLGLSDSDLSDLLIYRGLALTERGDAGRAWEDFVRAATIDPSRRLDPVRFPPRVVETFARAVRAVAGAPPARLTIDLPAGCQVWLDGRSVTGQSSMSVSRGEHYVRARCAQRAPYGARVLVAADAHRMAPEMAPLLPPTDDAIRAAAQQRGFVSAVSATLTPGAGGALLLNLRLIDAATGRSRGMVVVTLARPDRTAPVGDGMNRLLTPVTAPLAATARAPERPAPWYRRPWVWGIAGAAVAAAVLVPFAVDTSTPADYDVRPGGDLPP
jgi:hypothetical protein